MPHRPGQDSEKAGQGALEAARGQVSGCDFQTLNSTVSLFMTFMNVRMIEFVEITNSGVIAPLWILQPQNIMNGVYERLNPFSRFLHR